MGLYWGHGMQQASESATTPRSLGGQIGEERNGRRRDTADNTRFHAEDTETRDKKTVQGISEVSATQERSGAQTLYPAVIVW